MIYTFREILDKHGVLIHELRENLPTDEKERYAYLLGMSTVLYGVYEKSEASKIFDAVSQEELIDYVLTLPKMVDGNSLE